jgi:hypothetical protein
MKIPIGNAVPDETQRNINHTIEKIIAFENEITYLFESITFIDFDCVSKNKVANLSPKVFSVYGLPSGKTHKYSL